MFSQRITLWSVPLILSTPRIRNELRLMSLRNVRARSSERTTERWSERPDQQAWTHRIQRARGAARTSRPGAAAQASLTLMALIKILREAAGVNHDSMQVLRNWLPKVWLTVNESKRNSNEAPPSNLKMNTRGNARRPDTTHEAFWWRS